MSTTAQAQGATAGPMECVGRFLEAFNRHDPVEMAAGVSEDFELFYVAGSVTTRGAQGPAELEASMREYFEAVPSVGSEMEEAFVAGSFVSFRETARWGSEGRERSQSSPAVYEVRGCQIVRAWYFEAGP